MWNSTLKQVQSIIRLSYKDLSDVCTDHPEALPTEREWTVMKELVEVLNPFLQATDLLQGDRVVTISAVVPSILSINHHLQRLQESRDRYLMSMIKALQKSLKLRFSGLFVNVGMARREPDAPFSEKVYQLSSLLDPTFGLMWVDIDVLVEEEAKTNLKISLKGLLLHFGNQVPRAIIK
jgi:hypothetical protein